MALIDSFRCWQMRNNDRSHRNNNLLNYKKTGATSPKVDEINLNLEEL